MTLSTYQVSLLLTTTALLILAAHALGGLFAKLRQPAVIGEILAGLVLGPTVLGLLAPRVAATLFPTTGVVSVGLGVLSELGLLLLMFVIGGEMQVRTTTRDKRTIGWVAVTGLTLPFGVGAVMAQALDHRSFSGPGGSRATFALVFSIAVAVTSIPVISRIMLDLGLLDTRFARIVLSVAAVEDVLLYGVLAVVLSMARASTSDDFGLWALMGVHSTVLSVVYHAAVTVAFVAAFLFWGNRVLARVLRSRVNIVERRSPAAFRLALLLFAVLVCTVLGINPIFGALLVGFSVRRSDMRHTASATDGSSEPGQDGSALPDRTDGAQRAWEAIGQFSLAFFIPIYFVTVGLKLDLVRNFDPVFFLWFLLLCCVVKAASIWCGARLAGEPAARSFDLAVALNARGGPGIVLATVTLDAHVINVGFFTSIVLLSIITSQVSGFWLDRRLPALRAAEGRSPHPGFPVVSAERRPAAGRRGR